MRLRRIGLARHHQAEHVTRGVARHDADDPAAVHDGDAVGERDDLVELRRHHDDGNAGVAGLDDAGVHELDRPDIEPTGRLGGDEEAQLPTELARQHDLLLVAAGQPSDVGRDALGSDVELDDLLLGEGVQRLNLQEPVLDERRPDRAVEHEVLGDRELGHEAVLGPILWHEADAGVEHAARAAADQLGPVEGD